MFSKFFNIGETEESMPERIDLSRPHIVLNKLDGSMIGPFVTPIDGRLRYGSKKGITPLTTVVEDFVRECKSEFDRKNSSSKKFEPTATSPSNSESNSCSSSTDEISKTNETTKNFIIEGGHQPTEEGIQTKTDDSGSGSGVVDRLPPIDYDAFCLEWIAAGYTPIFEWCSRRTPVLLDYAQDSLTLVSLRHMRSGAYYDLCVQYQYKLKNQLFFFRIRKEECYGQYILKRLMNKLVFVIFAKYIWIDTSFLIVLSVTK